MAIFTSVIPAESPLSLDNSGPAMRADPIGLIVLDDDRDTIPGPCVLDLESISRRAKQQFVSDLPVQLSLKCNPHRAALANVYIEFQRHGNNLSSTVRAVVALEPRMSHLSPTVVTDARLGNDLQILATGEALMAWLAHLATVESDLEH